MATDSDSSDFDLEESDDTGEADDDGDLSQLGAAATSVKFETVQQRSYHAVDRGKDGLEQQIINSCERSNGAVVPVSGQPEDDQALDLPAGRPVQVVQQNFIQVQQQFGDVSVQGTRNLTIGGTQNITRGESSCEKKTKTMTWTENIRRRTASRLKTWTKGMVRTSALKRVMEKLDRGTTWVTIKGGPGEGKSTVAYMALLELQKSERQVFQVISPEEFSGVTMNSSRPVIMLDDIFGDLEFDYTEWLKWKPILHQTLDEKEHRSHEEEEKVSEKNDTTVILVGRNYVLNSASSDMGRLSDFLNQDLNVVDMSHSVERELQEKLDIWEAIVEPNIKLSRDTILRVCEIKGQHGFPHVCRLFATMYKRDASVCVESFFTKPLEFLNQTIKKFMHDDKKLVLFKEMMHRNGEVRERELVKLDSGAKIIQLADDLIGTYLRKEDDTFTFDHPSVYDSVAYNLCSLYPLFVIENCDLAFLHDRLRLRPLQDETLTSESELVTYLPRSYSGDLAKRFASEISRKNLLQVLSHKACADELFIEELMAQITVPLNKLLYWTDSDTKDKFLSLVVSNKSPNFLKYVSRRTNILTDDIAIKDILRAVCRIAAYDVLVYLSKMCNTIDINVRFREDRMTPLMVAAETKDGKFVQFIMSFDPDLSAQDTLGKSAIHYICANGLVSVADEVLSKGSYIEDKDVFGQSPLYYACERNQPEMARLLLDRGAKLDPDAVNIAYIYGNMDVVIRLFDMGATVNMIDTDGDFPIHSASIGGHLKMINYLIERGANVNQTGKSNRTPLHLVCWLGLPQVVQCLLGHGAATDSRDNEGDTPLHDASWLTFKECIGLLETAGDNVTYSKEQKVSHTFSEQKRKCVDALIEADADVNAQNKAGNTVLHTLCRLSGVGSHVSQSVEKAAELMCGDLVTLLVKAGADVNTKNNEGFTPLHNAAAKGCVELTGLLLKSRADVSLQAKDGSTALHKAVFYRKKQCVDLLLKNGSDINVQDKDGYAVLHTVTQRQSLEWIHLLLKAGAKVNVQTNNGMTSLHIATERGSKQCVKLLIKNGADVNLQDQRGFTPLHKAAEGRFEELMKHLLKPGANVNVQNHDCATPLHIAAEAGSSKCIRALLTNLADISVQRNDGCTPLHIAAEFGYAESVLLLLESGACVNSRDKVSQIALHKAANLSGYVFNRDSRADYKIFQALIKHGADVNAQDENGNTALHLLCHEESNNEMYEEAAACGFGDMYSHVVRELIDAGGDINLKNNAGELALCDVCQKILTEMNCSEQAARGDSQDMIKPKGRGRKLKKTCRTQ